MERKKEYKKPRIGIYSMGLKHYWGQFEGLKDRLLRYGEFVAEKTRNLGAEIWYYGLVDCEQEGRKAGEYFVEHQVDLIFAHSATYVTSASVLPIHQLCKAPVVILNLQPAARLNYQATTTGEWLAHCGACPVPEMMNAFHRSGIQAYVINGLLGLSETPAISMANEVTCERKEAIRAWELVKEWVLAAKVKRNLSGARFGFLGNAYSGMLDMYSDYTMFQAQTGAHVQVLEMCDLDRHLQQASIQEVERKREQMNEFFISSDDNASDPLAAKPSEQQLQWSAKVAVALDRLVEEYGLDALSYYYHGSPGNHYEDLQGGMIVGLSLLTAGKTACAGEGDLKTCLAMKISDIIGKGGSFCEIVCTDYEDGTILMGHDGPFHLAIAKGQAILRGMGLYHGKQGMGVSVEAKVKPGEITTLGCTQTVLGKLKFIISEAFSTDGEIMAIGNTQTPVRFSLDPDAYMDKWFEEAPTHHFAMSTGHNASVFKKAFLLLGIQFSQIDEGQGRP